MSMPEAQRKKAEEAVKTLIEVLGDDPGRAELLSTPSKVVDFYRNYFQYDELDPASVQKISHPSDSGRQKVGIRNISLTSFCEHHLVPIEGQCSIIYVPKESILGVGSMIRVVQRYARRLQIQERLTRQIASAIKNIVDPEWVQVKISAVHKCLICSDYNQGRGGPKLYTTYSIGNPMCEDEELPWQDGKS